MFIYIQSIIDSFNYLYYKIKDFKKNIANEKVTLSNKIWSGTYVEGKVPTTLGWFNLWGVVPKVLRYSSTVIFPIAYTPKASPNEKISKIFQIYYGSKRIIVLLYRVILAILVNHKLLKKSMKEMN